MAGFRLRKEPPDVYCPVSFVPKFPSVYNFWRYLWELACGSKDIWPLGPRNLISVAFRGVWVMMTMDRQNNLALLRSAHTGSVVPSLLRQMFHCVHSHQFCHTG